jgi:signal transduction histidine kinase
MGGSRRRVAVLVAALAAALPSRAVDPFTDVREIIRLPRDAADMALPVKLRAVVTWMDPARGRLFVQSGHDGISVRAPRGDWAIARGDLVDVEGVTTTGPFVPEVASSRVARVGPGALPEPDPLRLTEYVNGTYEARLMSVSGVVRTVRTDDGRPDVQLATAFGRARVVFPQGSDPAPLARLVGAQVLVRGAFGTDLSPQGQLAGLHVHAQDAGDVTVFVPPVPLDEVPYRVLAELGRYDPASRALGRVRTRGIATFKRADGALFIQDGGSVALVRTADAPDVRLGEPIEVVGFAAVSDGMLKLEDAILSPGPTLPPLTPHQVVDPAELGSQGLDGQLVAITCEATLATRHTAEVVITTRPTGMAGFLEVRLPIDQGSGLLDTLRPGSIVQVTGVKLPLVSSSLGTRWPVVLARSSGDVVVLQAPPFWTLARASAAAALLLVVAVGGALYTRWRVGILQRLKTGLERRVEARTRDLALANGNLLKLDVLRRRFLQMAAHDLRSPLAVLMSNSSFLLSLPELPPAVREPMEENLAASRRMHDLLAGVLSRDRIEHSRLHAVRLNLAHPLAEIPERLGRVAARKEQRLEVSVPEAPAWVLGDAVLVAHVVDNLVENALKFSPAGATVRAELRIDDVEACVLVEDRGPGLTDDDLAHLFVAGARLSAKPTAGEPSSGIGLSLAKAWVEAMDGRIWAERRDGGGARFCIAFPLDGEVAARAAADPPPSATRA